MFGEVFRANRTSIVRVETGGKARRFSTGFVIGAKGEVVFGARRAPEGPVVVHTHDGRTHPARVLAHNRGLRLGLARMTEFDGDYPPLRPGTTAELRAPGWVVSVAFLDKKSAEPYAGTVDSALTQRRKSRPSTMRLHAPGDLGSPVLGLDGALVGVIYERGRRRTRLVPVQALVSFLGTVPVER